MKICYIPKKFKESSLWVVERANEIIADYAAQSLSLTLRQLYYRFVAGDLIPNTQRDYKRLGSIINDARLAGLVDWYAIEDRGRNLISRATWDDPGEIIESAARGYRIDVWEGQPFRVEVWVEKQALEAVVGRGCEQWRAPYISCKGYMSQSEMWRAARRFARWQDNGQTPVVIHLGDHDPSGIDMTRDIAERLGIFQRTESWRAMDVKRIALNMDQVEEHEPPPNPAKVTDSRYDGYVVRFGDESWELDALEPAYMVELISKSIGRFIDADLWEAAIERETDEREILTDFAATWNE
jgi:hypothetical protein